MHRCPHCRSELPRTRVEVHDATAAIAAADAATAPQRVVLGDGAHASVVVFRGPAGPAPTHVHDHHDELAVVLEGSGTLEADGRVMPLGPGSVMVIPEGVEHTARFDAPFLVVSIYAPLDDPDHPDRRLC